MLKKFITVLILIIMTANLTACGAGSETEAGPGEAASRYEAEFLQLFDTLTRIIGYAGSEEEFTGYAELIHDNLEEYHQLYDIYHDYDGINNIKTINDQAGIAPVKVDRRIIDLLLFAKEAYELTDGQLNVALGAVLSIWHDYREAGIEDPERAALPPAGQLKEAAKHTDIDQVVIDEENSTVFLEDSAMSLDVGAIAKGYAVEQVAEIAEKNGVTSCLISVGGNVRAIGARGDGVPWKVGIQNPLDQNGEDISKVSLADASLVTSGIYERYYIVDGKKYHHIIDPDTLFPSEYFASVSVLCKDSGMADALAKVINMPFEEGLTLIEGLPDTEAVWVTPDGQVKYSSGFRKYIAD
jgi:thiamine biosynthesis lipoprotein